MGPRSRASTNPDASDREFPLLMKTSPPPWANGRISTYVAVLQKPWARTIVFLVWTAMAVSGLLVFKSFMNNLVFT